MKKYLLSIISLLMEISVIGQEKIDTMYFTDVNPVDSTHEICSTPKLRRIISTTEMKKEYRDGDLWLYYENEKLAIRMSCRIVRDYGKYFKISAIITNRSSCYIDYDPEEGIFAYLETKKVLLDNLKVYTIDEYMKRVRRRQNWTMTLLAFSEGLAALGAGYSTSSISGYSSNYGSYYAEITSYDAAAAYYANIEASRRISLYRDELLGKRIAKDVGYLKRTRIYPGETIFGDFYVERKKGLLMVLSINVDGNVYYFPWNVESKKKKRK